MLTNETKREFERIPPEISKSIFDAKYQPKIEIIPEQKLASLSDHPNEKLISSFLKAVKTQNAKVIEKFATENFSKGFLGAISMQEITKVLTGFGSEIKDKQIKSITIKGSETLIKFTGKSRNLKMRFNDKKIARVGF